MSEITEEKTSTHCQHGRTHFSYCADCHVLQLQETVKRLTKEKAEAYREWAKNEEDLHNQNQQLREENERLTKERDYARLKAEEAWKENVEAEEMIISLRAELEQVKKERDEHLRDCESISASHMETITHARALEAELAEKDKVLESYAEEDEFHCGNCDQFHRDPEYGEKARTILSQYKKQEIAIKCPTCGTDRVAAHPNNDKQYLCSKCDLIFEG